VAQGFWQSVTLNQKPYRVIGVMRSDFDWPRGKDLWTPMGLDPEEYSLHNRFNEGSAAVVRLQPGVSFVDFSNALAKKSHDEYVREGQNGFADKSAWGMAATPLTEFAAGPLRKPLYVLFGVVALVLFIASANVAGLFLARASARTREFAIRTALGASAWRLARQMLTETLLLAGVATVIGVACGPAFGRMLLVLVPQSLAEGYTVNMSLGILVFTAVAGLVTSLIAGMGPAVKLVRAKERLALHDGGRSATTTSDKQRLRSAFVIGEVAMAFVLLAGTGLFLASLRQLQQINPGFNPHGVLSGIVGYSGEDYKDNPARQESFVNTVLQNLAGQPGVKTAAVTTLLPFNNQNRSGSFRIEGQVQGPNDPGPHSQLSFVTADYLKTMQIPLLAGRWISSEDHSNTQRVVVVDQRLAKKYWPNQNPLGQHLRYDDRESWAEVVGVVADVRPDSLEEDVSDGMRYYPYSQSTNVVASFVVRTDGDPYQLMGPLQRAIAAADSTQTAFNISSLQAKVEGSLASRRLIVWLLTAFAGLALVLALVGIYGLISYVTEQRTSEIGIRMALGAQRVQVVGMIMKSALAWIATGLVIGCGLSVFAASLLKQLFSSFGGGVVSSLGIAMIALLSVGGLAGLLPARRAASIDPATTLRNE
jgi:predicted permease